MSTFDELAAQFQAPAHEEASTYEEYRVSLVETYTKTINDTLAVMLVAKPNPFAYHIVGHYHEFCRDHFPKSMQTPRWMSDDETLAWGTLAYTIIKGLLKTHREHGEETAKLLGIHALLALEDTLNEHYPRECPTSEMFYIASALLAFFYVAVSHIRKDTDQDRVLALQIINSMSNTANEIKGETP